MEGDKSWLTVVVLFIAVACYARDPKAEWDPTGTWAGVNHIAPGIPDTTILLHIKFLGGIRIEGSTHIDPTLEANFKGAILAAHLQFDEDETRRTGKTDKWGLWCPKHFELNPVLIDPAREGPFREDEMEGYWQAPGCPGGTLKLHRISRDADYLTGAQGPPAPAKKEAPIHSQYNNVPVNEKFGDKDWCPRGSVSVNGNFGKLNVIGSGERIAIRPFAAGLPLMPLIKGAGILKGGIEIAAATAQVQSASQFHFTLLATPLDENNHRQSTISSEQWVKPMSYQVTASFGLSDARVFRITNGFAPRVRWQLQMWDDSAQLPDLEIYTSGPCK